MIILGLNAYHGDVSVALVRDGQLVAAVEEERFTRIKHWAGFPAQSIMACLAMANIRAEEVDHFAVSRNPRANMMRKLMFAIRKGPSPRLILDRARNSRQVHDVASRLAETLGLSRSHVVPRVHWIEHHPTHLASAFFVSPFEESAVCAIDGFGDFVSTSAAIGSGSKLRLIDKIFFPHSLGLLYLAITQFLGFWKYGDEYKVMGLAPYGSPEYAGQIEKMLVLRSDGSYTLDLSYFCHWSGGAPMTWDNGEPTIGAVFTQKLERLLGPARKPDEPVTHRHEAIAASVQVVFERAAFHYLNAVYRRTKLRTLCLAGGCGMNSVMNGKIRENTPFQDVYIQPAAGDNGTALGAAFYVWNQILGRSREFVMRHSYWGPEFCDASIEQALKQARVATLIDRVCILKRIDSHMDLCEWVSGRIASAKVVGWFQGRMEWGARALGNRSIVADPRRSDMRDIINTKIKFREKFRPFAPSILEECLDEYFVGAVRDPFMIQVYPVRPEKRASIPAVTHVDGSGRLQTVSRDSNPLYWLLLKTFESRTGVPILLNTSFNENEPIVHQPSEALDCFLRTDMDALALGNYVLEKRLEKLA